MNCNNIKNGGNKAFNKIFFQIVIIVLFLYGGLIDAKPPVVQIFTKQPQQGSMVVGRILVDGDIFLAEKPLSLSETGEFVFGVGREENSSVVLKVHSNNEVIDFPIAIKKREWKIEKINGLDKNKVNPKSKQTLKRIKSETIKVKQARNIFSEQMAFLMPFVSPAKGRISGVYGSQRILNGEKKRPHYGLDIANKVGTTVISPADGIVTFAEKDLFYSGGTIIIDHGFGINTTYIHLEKLKVKVGQKIIQGEKIATMGSTGRATGPHLDWRLNWFSTRLDPQLLLGD